MKKIGLALGGGGARGLAHLGILRVIAREGIPVDGIAGTSMGAIVGACFAADPDIERVERLVREALTGPALTGMRFSVFKQGGTLLKRNNLLQKAQDALRNGYIHIVEETKDALLGLDKLEEAVKTVVPDIDIRETRIPFACVGTDLANGSEKVFTAGSLRKAVLASASIPGIFPPVLIDGLYYNDGGTVSVTPVRAARLTGADIVVACDVKSRVTAWVKPERAREIVSRCNYITGILLNELQLREADAVISPAVKHLPWFAFDDVDFLVEEGEKSAAERLPELQRLVREHGRRGGFGSLLRLLRIPQRTRPLRRPDGIVPGPAVDPAE